MPAIIITMDEDAYRNACDAAASMGTTLPALVERYVMEVASGETDFERLRRREGELRAQVVNFDAARRLSCDEVYRRSR